MIFREFPMISHVFLWFEGDHPTTQIVRMSFRMVRMLILLLRVPDRMSGRRWLRRPKTGSNKAKIRKNAFCFSWCFNVFITVLSGFLGGLNIPKWLIHDSWSIAILFEWFLEQPKMLPNLDPRAPYISPKYFKQYKKLYKGILGKYYFHIWESVLLKSLEGVCT